MSNTGGALGYFCMSSSEEDLPDLGYGPDTDPSLAGFKIFK